MPPSLANEAQASGSKCSGLNSSASLAYWATGICSLHCTYSPRAGIACTPQCKSMPKRASRHQEIRRPASASFTRGAHWAHAHAFTNHRMEAISARLRRFKMGILSFRHPFSGDAGQPFRFSERKSEGGEPIPLSGMDGRARKPVWIPTVPGPNGTLNDVKRAHSNGIKRSGFGVNNSVHH